MLDLRRSWKEILGKATWHAQLHLSRSKAFHKRQKWSFGRQRRERIRKIQKKQRQISGVDSQPFHAFSQFKQITKLVDEIRWQSWKLGVRAETGAFACGFDTVPLGGHGRAHFGAELQQLQAIGTERAETRIWREILYLHDLQQQNIEGKVDIFLHRVLLSFISCESTFSSDYCYFPKFLDTISFILCIDLIQTILLHPCISWLTQSILLIDTNAHWRISRIYRQHAIIEHRQTIYGISKIIIVFIIIS